MGFGSQLLTLLHKDIVIRRIKRRFFLSLLDLLLPLVTIILSVWLRNQSGNSDLGKWMPASTYEPVGPFTKDDIKFRGNVRIAYAPNNSYANVIMKNVYEKAAENVSMTPFANCDDLYAFLGSSEGETIDMAVEFSPDMQEAVLNYTLQFSQKYGLGAANKFDPTPTPRMNRSIGEMELLWPSMYAIFKEHARFYSLPWSDEDAPKMHPFPSGKYFRTPPDGTNFYQMLGNAFGQLLAMSYAVFLTSYAKNIISEKESRLREMMRMMGMSDTVYWINAFLVGMSTGVPICILLTVGLCVPFAQNAPFYYTSWSLILVILLMFTIGVVLLVLLVTVLLNSPKGGSLAVGLIMLASMALVMALLDRPGDQTYVDYLSKSPQLKLLTGMIPFIGIHWLTKFAMFAEQNGVGLQWRDLGGAVIPGDNVSPLSIMAAMMIMWVLLVLVTLYLDAIVPWQSGMPKHPLFFLQKSFWMGPPAITKGQRSVSDATSDIQDDDLVEPVSNSDKVIIQLRNVSHSFGPVRAVKNLSLDLYANQITMLLGHNGAGKTTTMNILTGLFPPTGGEVFINGFNVKTHTRRARAGVGLCPQHNVLFDELTVREHLHFFATLKGAPRQTISREVDTLAKKLGLSLKADTMSKDLSGGMKRKLSLGNAMVGGSSVLILDEPTAGMDPEARRGVWNLLQEERRTRTVLMTTHYMEEADVLGDRIAFVADGRLLSAGSPMFLKRKFDTGYKLRLSKVSHQTDVQRVLDEVKGALNNDDSIHVSSNLGYEFTINIGFPENERLVTLFKLLEAEKANLQINSIGISVTTMEDVFMKVGEAAEAADAVRLNAGKPNGGNGVSKGDMEAKTLDIPEINTDFDRMPSGLSLSFRRLNGLLCKRWHALRREWRIAQYLTVLPVIFAIAYCILVSANTTDRVRSVTYTLGALFGETQGFVSGQPDQTAAIFVDRLRNDQVTLNNIADTQDINEYLLAIANASPQLYKVRWSVGLQQSNASDFQPMLWFNPEPYHMGAAIIAHWQSAALARLININNNGNSSSSSNSTASPAVIVTNRPLGEEAVPPVIDSLIIHMQSTVFMGIVVSYLAAFSIMFPVQERVSKSKLVQLMSGVSRFVYIGANFLFDMGVMLVPIILTVLVCVILNPLEGFRTFNDTWIALFVVLLSYGAAMLPLMYAASYLFRDSATALSVMQSLTMFPVLLVGVVVIMLDMLAGNTDLYVKLASFLPGFAATYGIGNVHLNGQAKHMCERYQGTDRMVFCRRFPRDMMPCCQPCPGQNTSTCFQHSSPFSFDPRQGVLFQVVAMLGIGLGGFVLLVFMETYFQRVEFVLDYIVNLVRRNDSKSAKARANGSAGHVEDADVIAERLKVDAAVSKQSSGDYALLAHNLSKSYGTFQAVKGISFSLLEKECFGLLGVNGAGKSTTFGMLTGDQLMTAGNAYIKGVSLRKDLTKFQKFIGYCPQENALIDTMTGRETLELLCALRGVPREQTPALVDKVVTMSDLKENANKMTNTYSGGNKRKLSVAVAMIANPALLYLDEPTAGVDPGARRKIWGTLAGVQRNQGSSILLTSHSMEECEALCHRIGIMVAGSLRCLGSSQHLKAKFSQGFTVHVKLSDESPEKEKAVCDAMDHLFEGRAYLKQSYQRLLKFHVGNTDLQWSEVFERILKLRSEPELAIEDVQVSDTTLEEVFLNFADPDLDTVVGDV